MRSNNEVLAMKKYASIISLLILPAIFLVGCNFMGPSKRQVRKALWATIRSFTSSLDEHQDIKVKNVYANAADAVFRNPEDSVVTTMSIIMKEDGFHVFGTSTIADYEDAKSDYTINGELTYNLWYPSNLNPHEAFGEISCSVVLSGGIIKSMEFTVSGDNSEEMENYIITANNESFEFNNYASFFELFDDITSKMSG